MMPAFGAGSAVYLPMCSPYTTRMRPSEALAQHRDAVCNAAARYPVSNMRVFGSVLHGHDAEGSDLDLLVDPIRCQARRCLTWAVCRTSWNS